MRLALVERAVAVGGKLLKRTYLLMFVALVPQFSKKFNANGSVAQYWAWKFTEPGFHPGEWGSVDEDVGEISNCARY